jgi:hypothetical protein
VNRRLEAVLRRRRIALTQPGRKPPRSAWIGLLGSTMQKLFITLGMIVGSIAGGYLPMLFGAGLFSITSLITSTIGGLLGIYIGYRLGENY